MLISSWTYFQAEDKKGEDAILMLHISLHYYVFIIILFVHAVSKYISPKPLECLERCFLSLFYKSKEWKLQRVNLYFGDIENNFGNITLFSVLE